VIFFHWFASPFTQAQRGGDLLVAKEHICRKCRFEGKGAACLASELLEADDIDRPPGTQLPMHMQKYLLLSRRPYLRFALVCPFWCKLKRFMPCDTQPPDEMFQRTVDRISKVLRTRASTGGAATASSPEVGDNVVR